MRRLNNRDVMNYVVRVNKDSSSVVKNPKNAVDSFFILLSSFA